MATYLRPGVFIEETLQPLAGTDLESSDSIAAFVGTSSQGGPVGPTLVTSWSQYQTLFGSIRAGRDALSYGVYSFFNNGGTSAFIVRAVNEDATPAEVSLNGTQEVPAEVLTVTAKAPGTWSSDPASSSRVQVTVTNSSDAGRFDLTVEVGSGASLVGREQFLDLTLNPSDSRYALGILNSPTVGSKYVVFEHTGVYTGPADNPAAVTRVPLVGGTDGTGNPDLFTAVQALEEIDSNLTLALPGVSDPAILTDVINWAETRGTVFVIVDTPKPTNSDTVASATTALTTFVGSLPKSSHAAVYGPWLHISDPASSVSGALQLVAASGVVAGQYARTDITRGVQKAPAGTETSLKGVIGAAIRFTDSALDTLNQAGVNVIRTVPGAGFCIMGSRTLNTRTPDRYVNVRRTLMYLKRALVSQTRFAVFEPNDPNLWATLSAVCTQYLTTQYSVGTLKGNTQDQAFFVRCDESLNTPDVVNAGMVKIEIGVAIASPAEFVVIRIGQFDGGTTVEDVDAA